jgi:hypothetical protein
MPPLQSISGAVYRLMGDHHPEDFPPSLFIHTALSMLEPSLKVGKRVASRGSDERVPLHTLLSFTFWLVVGVHRIRVAQGSK